MTAAATVGGDERLRLFVAFELPDDIAGILRQWAARHLGQLRPVAGYHVTVAFLGARPRSDLPAILACMREAAAHVRPFTLGVVRYLETRSVGMLVLDDHSGEATRLAGDLQLRLEELGVYRRERRPWLPHVTVVRFRERPRLAPPLPEMAPFAPSAVAAYLSRLHPSGARYEVLESCPLEAVGPGG